MINILEFIINKILPIVAICFAGLGLGLWRKQLRGGDLYNYAKEALFELKKLLNLIDNYRYIFITEEDKIRLWLEIQNQYTLYEYKIILINILSKNKIDDKINGKNIKDHLTIMYKLIFENNSIKEMHKNNEISHEERKKYTERLLEIDKILHNRGEQDEFGDFLNEYFLAMCTKLKKYLK